MANEQPHEPNHVHRRGSDLHTERPALRHIVDRNIRRIARFRKLEHDSRTPQQRIADRITDISGSIGFVYFHIAWFGTWIALNGPWSGVAFDPFPFGLLTMIVSLEAIFLSTFVLLTQNRLAQTADVRDDLDLQVDLLAEYELTKSLHLIKRIAEKLGIEDAEDSELSDLEQPTPMGEVLKQVSEADRDEQARRRVKDEK